MKKTIVKSFAFALALTFSLSCVSVNAQGLEIQNISGANRFTNAITISKNGWSNGSEYAILVNSHAVSDSLSVAPLASKLNAPILLTGRDSMDINTYEEIKRLKAKKIIIIGGELSVSKDIENSLIKESYEVNRIAGKTRVEASFNIANELSKLNNTSAFNEAFVVNGYTGLADAAGIGSIAAKKGAPIIYIDKNNFSALQNKIASMNIGKIYLIGGNLSVPESFDQISSNTERISGGNRIEANANIINRFYDKYDTVYITDDGSKDQSRLIDATLINSAIISSNNQAINAGSAKTETTQPSITKPSTTEPSITKPSTTEPSTTKPSTTEAGTAVIDTSEVSANGSVSTNPQTGVGIDESEDSSANNQITSGDNVVDAQTLPTENQNDSKAVLTPVSNDENLKQVTETSTLNPQIDNNINTTNQKFFAEGPVMLVSSKNGLSFSQLKILNNDINPLNKIVQVSGGEYLGKYINFVADFVNNKGLAVADQAFNKILSYENVTIEYKFDGKIKRLYGSDILKMIICSQANGFKVEFNQDMIKDFVNNIDPDGYQIVSGDSYAYWKNGDVIIAKQKTTMSIDKNSVITNLNNMLNQAKSFFAVQPKYIRTSATKIPSGATNIGKKYIEVDIGTQDMRMWNYGKQILYTPVVTGNPNRGMSTPIGIYKIQYMQKNRVLRGPGYASHVDYWISFNGPYGIHDSYWQAAYGGSRYLYAGSHGCVNTPLKNMAFVYNNSSLGTPVIIHK